MDPQQFPPEQPAPPKPVAYDAEGKPLYAAPPPEPTPGLNPQSSSHVTAQPESQPGEDYNPRLRAQYANEPRVVHATRPLEPEEHELSDELKEKHDRSTRLHPNLNLSRGEFVILKIKRHPVGLWLPTISTIVIIVILLGALMAYPSIAYNPATDEVPGIVPLTIVIMCLIIMIGIGGYIAVWVYLRNTFYLTNESVIQEIQHSLFSKHEQTVSLGSIEDASFKQNGIFQSFLNYGTIRLSTEGEETTYRFQYVANPKKQIAVLNNAVEAFKNGRPVGLEHITDD